jgi:flagellar biosynthesis chaperone FliJ
MSRQHRHPPVSLFSFQDIITSTTAILIVIVLCLSLELLNRSLEPQQPVDLQTIDDLRESVSQLQTNLAALQTRPAFESELLAEAAEATPNQLRDELQDLERQLQVLQADVESETARAAQLAEVAKQTEATLFDAKPRLEELARLQEQTEAMRAKIEELKNLQRPLYTMPRGDNRAGWVVVVSNGRIETAPMGQPSAPLVFDDPFAISVLSSRPSARFRKWLEDAAAGRLYLLVLVRPDGSPLFDRLEGELVQRNVSFGFDLVAADQQVLDPRQGAALE